jgi:predicted phage terminase large subunit-like protein
LVLAIMDKLTMTDLTDVNRVRKQVIEVLPYFPRFDKEVRLNSQIARLESGNFLLPNEASWLEEFRKECLAFPNGKNDDMVDSFSQFLDWLGQRIGLSAIKDADYKARRRQ